MGLLSPRGSQITTTPVAATGFAMIMTRERCLLVLEFFFCFFFDQGIGSWSAAWASRVDVVWVSVCVSSVVGCWYCVWYIVVFMWHCMPLVCIPNYYVMVRCNDIHLAKASPICASILGGTFEFLLDRVTYWAWQVGIRASTDHRSPLIDRVVWPLSSLEENCFQSLVISESRNSFYSSAPSSLW